MYNFPSEGSKPIPMASPSTPRNKVRKESGYYVESWSASPLTRETLKRNAEEGSKREEQYVAWVNSQLKKRPGSRFVREIPRDTRDGVALVQLVEVLAGESLKFDESPTTYASKKENVDQVLHFMAAQKIKMRQISSKDIVEGNLKATMRLVLALAAHFKPGSVKPPSHQSGMSPGQTTKLTRSPSAAAAAAEAAAAIGEASRKAASAGRHIHMPFRLRTSKNPPSPSTPKIDRLPVDVSPGTSPLLSSSPLNTPLNRTPIRKTSRPSSADSSRRDKDNGSDGSNVSSGHTTPRLPHRDLETLQSASDSESASSKDPVKNNNNTSSFPDLEFLREVTEGYDSMEEDTNNAKEMLLHLQSLLLNGRVEEDEIPEEYCGLEGSTVQEQLTIVSSRLGQREADYDSLKTELNKTKEECINLQGIKAGLLSRLNQQEQTIMQLQSGSLKHELSQQQHESEVQQLQYQLTERDKEVSALRNELVRREKTVDKQRLELEDAMRHIEELQFAQAGPSRHVEDQIIIELQQRIRDLQEKLDSVGTYEATLSARISTQDEKMASLEDKILNPPNLQNSAVVSHGLKRSEEMEVVRDAIQSLRSCFKLHDPHHHTLDTLEQSIIAVHSPSDQHSHSLDSDTESINIKAMNGFEHSNGYNGKSLPHQRHLESNAKETSGIRTKVLYYTDNTVTPFLTSIPRRLGEITLGDFKEAIDRPGLYRYHFKALDPEFGTVKEEVIDDGDVVPGWEGKIVAWVEDDSGQKVLSYQEQTA
ncbi:dixin-like isoform X2 [Oculina patagonica]